MKLVEIFENNKEEITEQTLNLIPEAFQYENNISFFISLEDDVVTVDYITYSGNIVTDHYHFYTVRNYDIILPEDYGVECISDVLIDLGYEDDIKAGIEDQRNNLYSVNI